MIQKELFNNGFRFYKDISNLTLQQINLLSVENDILFEDGKGKLIILEVKKK